MKACLAPPPTKNGEGRGIEPKNHVTPEDGDHGSQHNSRSQRINVLQTHKCLEESASRQQDPTSPEMHRQRIFTTVYIAPRRLTL
jgi:hypothetical protein